MQPALTTHLRNAFTWQWIRKNKLLTIGSTCLAVFLLLNAFGWIKSVATGVPHETTAGDLLGLAIILLGWLGAKWAVRKLLWRLRNRLMVTYIFIGVIPIALIAFMAVIAGLLFSGQYAAQRMRSRVDAEVSRLELTTSITGTQLATGRLPELADAVAAIRHEYPTAEVLAWRGGRQLQDKATPATQSSSPLPPEWARNNFSGLVFDGGKLYLRVVKEFGSGSQRVVVLSSVPADEALFNKLLEGLATVEINLLRGVDLLSDKETNTKFKVGSSDGASEAEIKKALVLPIVKSGAQLKQRFRWDPNFTFSTVLLATDWSTGENLSVLDDAGRRSTILLLISTRPSAVYDELFASMGRVSSFAYKLLIIVAIVFGVIEVFALFIGFRLTRSITGAVAKLYRGTQRVNQGDLSCCIEVKSNDQLAELEKSFNNMTQSLVALIAEQKEKQRMESELAIAQEVQAQLFPHDTQQVRGLDLHGLCLPARTVSGDYYDFVPLDEENLLIALGDISGKGISAALLMATLHSAVRSYDLRRLALPEPTMAVASASSVSGLTVIANGASSVLANGQTTAGSTFGGPGPQCCVSDFMQSLNSQLYKSTPAAKYATLFLGCFHARTGMLTYSNGGHLAPIIVSADGRVRRLESGGMVVGLMDGMTYEQSSVAFGIGDLLVAFTDGITEPEDAEGNDFGEERLVELVKANRARELPDIANIITSAVKRYIGDAEQPDDMTIVLARAR